MVVWYLNMILKSYYLSQEAVSGFQFYLYVCNWRDGGCLPIITTIISTVNIVVDRLGFTLVDVGKGKTFTTNLSIL